MIRLALVGAGGHATHLHAPALQHYRRTFPGRVSVAVCDTDAARMHEAVDGFGFDDGYTDVETLRREFKPDAAMLIVPIAVTWPMVQTFLPDRIPLLIEKPLGEDLDQARMLTEAVVAADVPATVSLNRRFDPGYRLACHWLAERGPLRAVHGSQLRVRRRDDYFVWGTGIHLIDPICALTGPLRLVTQAVRVPGTDHDTWRLARLESDTGTAVTICIMPACGRMEEHTRFAGEGFCLDLWTGTSHPWRVQAWLEGACVLDEHAPQDQPEYLRGGTWDETRLFLDAVIDGNAVPGPSVEEALVSSEVVAAMEAGTAADSA